MTKQQQKEVDKLFRVYDKAEFALCQKRDEMFPIGAQVRSRIDKDFILTVRNGSLYPHQINTDWGHMSWRYLEVVG